jgi:hypothetical protein
MGPLAWIPGINWHQMATTLIVFISKNGEFFPQNHKIFTDFFSFSEK